MKPDVTVCIPVYKAEGFVRDAIESVLGQSQQRFKLHISIDPAGDGSGAICREYQEDPRVTVVENERRLGWVGNVNACLDRVDKPFFAFCFHDDIWEPGFLELLGAALDAAPNAVAAFGAIQRSGTKNTKDRPEDVVGTPMFRARDCLKGNFPAYNMKNLMRSGLVLEGLRLPNIEEDGFVADLPFALAYSLAGDFVSVPDLVYRKAHRTDSVTAGWSEYDTERFLRNVMELRLHLIRVVGSAELGLADRQELVELILRIRWSQRPSSLEGLHFVADTLDLLSPSRLIAELIGENTASTGWCPDPDQRRVELAESRLGLARGFRKFGDLSAARHYALQAIRLDASNFDAHCLLARVCLSEGKGADKSASVDLAFDHARKAIELEAENPIGWLLLARAQVDQGDWTAASDSAHRSISLGLSDVQRAQEIVTLARKRLWQGRFLGRGRRRNREISR